MTIDIEAIKARAEKATEGPWRNGTKVGRTVYWTPGTEYDADPLIGVMDTTHDAAFVAHARSDIPALIAALEEPARSG